MNCALPDIIASNQTYHGSILGLQDALLILEGIRQDALPQVKRRLNDAERKLICAGSIYAWNETTLGMKRWTDGKNWLASKVKGPFLIYHEHDTDRNIKPNGLVKQSFSLTTKQSEKLHLIAYYNSHDRMSGILRGEVPSQDPLLLKFNLDPSVYCSEFLTNGTREFAVLPRHHHHHHRVAPSDAFHLSQKSPMALGGFDHMRHPGMADPRIHPFMMTQPQMTMSHLHGPQQGHGQRPSWPMAGPPASNFDAHARIASLLLSLCNGATSWLGYTHVRGNLEHPHEKDSSQINHEKYAYARDLHHTQPSVSRAGVESVPSIFNAPYPRAGILTLPPLSESIGKLGESSEVPINLVRCSKTPDKEAFKPRILDKTFSV